MPYVAPELALVGNASDVILQKAQNCCEDSDPNWSGWASKETEW
jgi:hypothetical protein